ncbi:MAG TPA: DUF4440 domain-containing protein [Cyclobacteriaceae bacterium]|nr:DUF4440 domain-containing protein [Cyclobacteriaceae bacterium]
MKKVIILFAVMLTGCQQGGGPISQQDKDEIQKTIDAFANAIKNRTGDFGAVYTSDIISMPPHVEANTGVEKVTAFHSDPAGPKVTTFTVASQEIEGSADLAYARGVWKFEGVLNDTLNVSDNGKFVIILKKQGDGTWKTSREIWNSNVPIPGQ